MHESNAVEKRRHGNLRALVDRASPLPKATIRWGARRLEPNSLAELDARIARGAKEPTNPNRLDSHERLREVFDSATPDERDAIRYIVAKMGPSQVAELEELVGRNAKILRMNGSGGKAEPGI